MVFLIVHICMCMCMYMHMYMCTHTHTHTKNNNTKRGYASHKQIARVCICTYAHARTHAPTRARMHACTHVLNWIRKRMMCKRTPERVQRNTQMSNGTAGKTLW